MAKILIVSDMHCGSRGGLTPPQFNSWVEADALSRYRAQIWEWYTSVVKGKKFDLCIGTGDLIDGQQLKNRGRDTITTDFCEQMDIAEFCLSKINAKKWVFVNGTGYHVGDDFERIMADKYKAKCYDFVRFSFAGKIFNVRHKVGGTSVPYGKATSITKEMVFDTIMGDVNNCDKSADIFIRGHTHQPVYVYDPCYDKHCIITPPLQGPSSFGQKNCTGIIKPGLCIINIDKKGGVSCQFEMVNLLMPAQKTVIL